MATHTVFTDESLEALREARARGFPVPDVEDELPHADPATQVRIEDMLGALNERLLDCDCSQATTADPHWSFDV